VRAERKTLLESSPHFQALRGKTDEHKMLLRAGCRCLQNGALSESLFRSPCKRLAGDMNRRAHLTKVKSASLRRLEMFQTHSDVESRWVVGRLPTAADTPLLPDP